LVLSAVEQQKVVTDNAFTFKLLKNIAANDSSGDNIFISPLSVSFAMAMTSNGSGGQTLAAIRNAMDFNGFSQEVLNSYYNKLLTDLPELDPNTTINIANSIWYKQGFDVLPQFLSTNSTYYNAQTAALDFSSATAPQTINSWVNTQTNGKITSIVSQIPSNAVMYLINALYFKSTWKESFDPSQTKTQSFYVNASSTVQASLMSATVDINSYYDNDVTVFEMPYSNSKYSMVIVLPQYDKTLADISPALDSAKWAGWMAALHPLKQAITIPKFTFSYGVTLNDALTAFGMGVAFGDGANFTGIGPQGLEISQVKHKAFIAVDESGTEAAAVTSVGVVTSIAEQGGNYIVNRPFIFAIREMNTGLVLFTGVVNNPLLTGSN